MADIVCQEWTSSTAFFNKIKVYASGGIPVNDTSDILDRGLKHLRREEEAIAAQILKSKQPQRPKYTKQQTDWKALLLRKINGADTLDELDAIQIDSANVELTARILTEVEQRKEARRIEIQIAKQELELKETQIKEHIAEKQAMLESARQLQKEVLARHKIAIQQAIVEEQQAFLEQYKAQQQAKEFTRKRNNRIKRLKALMWLAKLDL